jgi:glyoxylase-like metal-dependent hydrolase (beta-lactamase superfamily II)
LDHVERYTELFTELNLQLVMAVDTHIHADHITALGALRDVTKCTTAMGKQSNTECMSVHFSEGELLKADGVHLRALYTPGHTSDSYSFLLNGRVLTGDTLLIQGTGRTDFQNGDPAAQYDSLFDKLLKLPDDTLVYPAHDYAGRRCSSIGTEKRQNPRLQVRTRDEYVEQMNALTLDPPKLIDVAVPANRRCGLKMAA